MKKYRKAIKITGECAAQLYACPVVRGLTKLDTPEIVETASGVEVVESLSSVVVQFPGFKKKSVGSGMYIVEDVCGHYELMTADEWANVKDDTIVDVTENPEELPEPVIPSDSVNTEGE